MSWSLQRRNGLPPPQNLVQLSKLMMLHTHQENMKRFITHIMKLSGKCGEASEEVQKCLERAGKGVGLGGLTVVGRRGWVRLLHKEGPWWFGLPRRARGGCTWACSAVCPDVERWAWKSSAAKRQNWSYTLLLAQFSIFAWNLALYVLCLTVTKSFIKFLLVLASCGNASFPYNWLFIFQKDVWIKNKLIFFSS